MGDIGGIVGGITSGQSAGASAAAQEQSNMINTIGSLLTTSANIKAQDRANQANYEHWLESRGSTGSAILPVYDKELEAKMSSDLSSMWNTPMKSQADYQNALKQGGAADANLAAMKGVSGIFNGQRQAQRLANMAPVAQARTQGIRQSSMDALSKTMGEIGVMQSAKGYEGDSMASNLMRFGANRAQGDAMMGANLMNLQDVRGIKDQSLNDQITYANLPYQMAMANLGLMQAPEAAWLQQYNARLQPMSFMKIGQAQPYSYQAYNASPPPQSTPVMSSSGIANMALGRPIGNLVDNALQEAGVPSIGSSIKSGIKSLFGSSSSPEISDIDLGIWE